MVTPAAVQILLVDDHPVVRDGLRGQLTTQSDLVVVAEAASAEEALAVLRTKPADVVITDLHMPGLGGIALIGDIRRLHPGTEVLVLTTYDTDEDVLPAIAAGARGYLLKDAGRHALFDAVRAASRGRSVLSPAISERLTRRPLPARLLSDRELEVLQLVAAGRTNRQIGAALFIGEATVKTHLQRIFAKLDVADRAAAVASGYRAGLL